MNDRPARAYELATVDRDDLPAWLLPVYDAVGTIRSRDLSPRMWRPPRKARESAVLMLFGEGEHGHDLLLTERAHTLRSHAGQVSFPGGRRDPGDLNAVHTALREAVEEVGLDPAGVEIIGTLPPLWIPPSNSAVTTVVGWWARPSPVRVVDPAEVASVWRSPIADLTDPDRRFTVRHPSGWKGPGFVVGRDDRLVLWGFTAGIVSRLFAAVGWERPWDQSVIRSSP